MHWRVSLPTMLLAWVLLAAPGAAAGIQRHVDSQGVISISNSPSAPSIQSQQENPGTATAPLDQGGPDSEPSLAAAEKPIPRAQGPAARAPGISAPAPGPGPDGNQDSQPRPEPRGLAAVPENGAEAGTLAVKKVAYTEAEAGPAAMPGPQVAATRKPGVVTEGGIRRFRDRQGVLHITNAGADREDSGTSRLQTDQIGGSGPGLPGAQTARAGAIPADLPLQKVAWSPDNPRFDFVNTIPAVGGNRAPGRENAIRHYRDSRGVIHIDNVAPGSRESSPKPQTLARAGPGDERAPPPESRPPPGGGAGVQLAQQPEDRSGAGIPAPPTALISAPFSQPETVLLGNVRRYRDGQGVWHLETAKAPGLQGAPRLPRLAELSQKLTLASLSPASAPPGASGTPGAAMQSGSRLGRTYGGIAVLRDSRGRLNITNAQPEAGVVRGLPVMEARAQLEPIIQEAAQVYGLPASLIRAVIKVESNFASWAVSPKGAMGLMQLMPGTATFLGVREPFNPRENILGGSRYLRLLIDFFGGSVPLALAGYNAGYQRVVACGYRVPDIKETQDFLSQVMGWYLAEEKKALLPRI